MKASSLFHSGLTKMASHFTSSLRTEVWGNTISSGSTFTEPATPRRMASLPQLIFYTSAWHSQGNATQ